VEVQYHLESQAIWNPWSSHLLGIHSAVSVSIHPPSDDHDSQLLLVSIWSSLIAAYNMNIDTLSYSSVIRAFASVGYHPDSCLTQHQYEVCLDKLVKRRYPQHTFDSNVASELFEQNDKGYDNTAKVSSYAMTVVTAFQILVERIVQSSSRMQYYPESVSGAAGEANCSEELMVFKEAKSDSESLLMAFGEKNTELETLTPPQINLSRILQASEVVHSQTLSTAPDYSKKVLTEQNSLEHQKNTPQFAQSPVMIGRHQPSAQIRPSGGNNKLQPLQTLLILAASLALVQLFMSRHKYHFMNLPAALAAFAGVSSRFRNKIVIKSIQLCLSVAVVLSVYWLVEVAVVRCLRRRVQGCMKSSVAAPMRLQLSWRIQQQASPNLSNKRWCACCRQMGGA
jgi:hypothetical protein